jgi:hypothetical protein
MRTFDIFSAENSYFAQYLSSIPLRISFCTLHPKQIAIETSERRWFSNRYPGSDETRFSAEPFLHAKHAAALLLALSEYLFKWSL